MHLMPSPLGHVGSHQHLQFPWQRLPDLHSLFFPFSLVCAAPSFSAVSTADCVNGQIGLDLTNVKFSLIKRHTVRSHQLRCDAQGSDITFA